MNSKKDGIINYDNCRYWYHVSTTLKHKHEILIPWDENRGFNRSGNEPDGKRICVSPTIEQCITAIPYSWVEIISIYRTKIRVKAYASTGVFDAKVTGERWLHVPTPFVKIGILNFSKVEKKFNVDNVIPEAASSGDITSSAAVFRWWKNANIKSLIKLA